MTRKLDAEIERTLSERAQYFTPRWFGRLFRARLSLADTFWVGMFGPLMVGLPLMFVIASASKFIVPSIGVTTLSAEGLILALYWLLVTRAVIVCALRSPQSGGWRWAAIVVATLMTLSVGLTSLLDLVRV